MIPPSIDHIIISTQIRCECGPTTVGDVESDPELMEKMDAKMVYRLGNTFAEYITVGLQDYRYDRCRTDMRVDHGQKD
uniref:GTP cyclohydrolase 1 feedback regulatory protein n=1 Tax=Ditylenchus dipsaci TaxID=166011 RepID=A0A915D9Z0_9BILA